MVNGKNHTVSNGDHCSFATSPCGNFSVFSIEIAIFVTYSRMCTFNERGFQKSISFSYAAIFLFAGTFITSGNKPGPRGKMIGITELSHNHTGLCNNSFGTSSANPRYFIKQFYVFFDGFCFFLISSSISAIDEERKSMC